MSDPRRELADLARGVRRELERRMDAGRTRLVDPRLRDLLAAPPPAPAAPAVRKRPAPDVPTLASVARPARAAAATPTKTEPMKKESAPAAGSAKSTPAPAAAKADEKSRGKKLSRIPIEPEAADYGDRMAALAALGEEAAGCTKCGLCKTRTKVVFGVGRARTRILFIGEAPGGDEDRQGFPFVGRAGKLLDQIIDAVGLERDEVYIANILKCRPPQNRDPLPEEIAACTPYLERQIELIQPKIICALGRFAAQFLTGELKAPMGALRGKVHYYQDRIMVVPTYHPAALLRNPNLKRATWEDVQLLRREYLR